MPGFCNVQIDPIVNRGGATSDSNHVASVFGMRVSAIDAQNVRVG